MGCDWKKLRSCWVFWLCRVLGSGQDWNILYLKRYFYFISKTTWINRRKGNTNDGLNLLQNFGVETCLAEFGDKLAVAFWLFAKKVELLLFVAFKREFRSECVFIFKLKFFHEISYNRRVFILMYFWLNVSFLAMSLRLSRVSISRRSFSSSSPRNGWSSKKIVKSMNSID